MSIDNGPTFVQDYSPMEVSATAPPKATWKSWKKKYEKMMITFRQKMKYSDALFREEQKVLGISKRIVEENDRLLDLLKELNTCPQIPPNQRFDLRADDDPARGLDDPSAAEYYNDISAAQKALQEARAELTAGLISPHKYQKLEDSILHNSALAPSLSLKSLSKVPHTLTAESRTDQSDGSSADLFSAFVTPSQEEEYLQELDTFIFGNLAGSRPHPFAHGSRGGDKSTERDRDAALRNPVSVYNWLRKHQPQVFLQDNELHHDKSTSRTANARTSKRTPVQAKQGQELDDDGILVEFTGSARGKRKRDDDGGYRPKGGSSRPTKRKKEDNGQAPKRGKKSSISEGVS